LILAPVVYFCLGTFKSALIVFSVLYMKSFLIISKIILWSECVPKSFVLYQVFFNVIKFFRCRCIVVLSELCLIENYNHVHSTINCTAKYFLTGIEGTLLYRSAYLVTRERPASTRKIRQLMLSVMKTVQFIFWYFPL